jgi:hypothetical protein
LNRRVQFFPVVLLLILLSWPFLFKIVEAGLGDGDYPFASIINWQDGKARKAYEKYFENSGITFERAEIVNLRQENRWAEREEFLMLRKDGMLVGYGVIFKRLFLPGYVERNGERRKLEVLEIEILYDLYGKFVFFGKL